MRPRHQGSAHDVILTGLDEEGDSTNEEKTEISYIRRFCFAFWDFASEDYSIVNFTNIY